MGTKIIHQEPIFPNNLVCEIEVFLFFVFIFSGQGGRRDLGGQGGDWSGQNVIFDILECPAFEKLSIRSLGALWAST